MKKFAPHLTAACLIIAICVSTAEWAFSKSDATTSYVTGLTSGRVRSLGGAALALFSLIIGWRLKGRAEKPDGKRRSWAIAGFILGLIAVVFSVVHLAGNTGGFGSGGGKAGSIVAVVLGLAGTALSGAALRSRGQ